MTAFTWNLCEPQYRPKTFNPNDLGLDYTDGADARWPNPGLVLGPSRATLDCGAVGGTAANTNAGAMMQRSSGGTEWFLYILRGTRVTKIQVPTLNAALALATTQPTSGATGDLGDRGITAIVTKAPSGTPILSASIDNEATAYHNLTTVAAENAADTWSACNESTAQWRVLLRGPDRMYGFGDGSINGNILTSTVTADASSWQELATVNDANLLFTGAEMTENLVAVGTATGLLILNGQYREFFPAHTPVPADPDNCRAMLYVEYLGLLVPLVNQLRLQNGASGSRVGPEAFGAPNVIQGTPTGQGRNADWVFGAWRNPKAGKTYILAFRPRQAGDWHGNPVSYYCIDSFDTACEWVHVLEDPGGIRTNQVLAVGNADDLSYYRIARTTNWTDDVSGTDNYLYAAATPQTAYGNQKEFDRKMRVQRVIFRGSSLAAGQTLTMKLGYRTVRGQESTITVVKENSSGEYTVALPQNVRLEDVVEFHPVVTLESNVTSASPCLVRGRVTVEAEPA